MRAKDILAIRKEEAKRKDKLAAAQQKGKEALDRAKLFLHVLDELRMGWWKEAGDGTGIWRASPGLWDPHWYFLRPGGDLIRRLFVTDLLVDADAARRAWEDGAKTEAKDAEYSAFTKQFAAADGSFDFDALQKCEEAWEKRDSSAETPKRETHDPFGSFADAEQQACAACSKPAFLLCYAHWEDWDESFGGRQHRRKYLLCMGCRSVTPQSDPCEKCDTLVDRLK